MKTLIKLIIAAVLVNAAYKGGSVFLKYYQFKDETQQMILFGQGQTVGDLTRQILSEATKREVPLEEDGVTVNREGARTLAEVAYTESVEVFPRYFYPVDFSFSAEAYGVAGASGARPRK
jgi:type III secretion system FlhB-like substrate exporter